MVYMARKIGRAAWVLCMLSWLGRPAAAQSYRDFSREAGFVDYLQDKGLYEDAVVALNEIRVPALDPPQLDSLRYLKGWSFYNLKRLDSSSYYLDQVTPASALFAKSAFFGAYNHIYLGQYPQAVSTLDRIPAVGDTAEILRFERAGVALLDRDRAAFDSLSGQFSYELYALSAQEKNLVDYHQQLTGIRNKSPFLAGLFSAILPGAGKVYAGKPYQGISTLFPLTALALLTHESYRKRGPHSAEFYLFGSLMTVFYVGNIWGSVFSVKIKRQEDENLIHQKVLLDLQIPLRTIFD